MVMRVWVHPTRDQLESGFYGRAGYHELMRKLQRAVERDSFHPAERYDAVVVLGGMHQNKEFEAQKTTLKLLMEAPLGFQRSISQTWHLYWGGRPFIGLLATQGALDRDAAFAHFADCGDVPEPSG